MKKLLFYTIAVLALHVISCKEKDPEIDCGCSGPTIGEIENVQASYIGSNAFIFRIVRTDTVSYEYMYSSCTPTDTLHVATDFKIPNYVLTGKIKENCFLGPTVIAQPQLFEITAIKEHL